MTQVLWPDAVRLLQTERLWTSKELVPENPSWFFVHHTSGRDRQPKSWLKSRETALVGIQKCSRDSVFPEIATYDNRTLTRKPLETVGFRRPSLESRHASSIQTFPKSGSDSTANQPALLPPQQVGSPHIIQSKRKTDSLLAKRSNSDRTGRSNPVSKELKALLVANERWNRNPGTDSNLGRCSSLTVSPEQHVEDINQETIVEQLHQAKQTELQNVEKNFESNFCVEVGEEVVVPSWRIVETKRRYVIEQTEDLSDDVFRMRHQKPEIDEKRRKRWDEQRQRDLKLLERLQNRKDQTSDSVQAKANPRTTASDSEISHIKVIEAEPVLAFGHFVASIPPREFSLPRCILQQSKSTANRSQTSHPSRKRYWK